MAKEARREIDLEITRNEGRGEEKAILTLTTDKGMHGGIRSSATVGWLSPDKLFRSHTFVKDYAVLVSSKPAQRVTQKAIDYQHGEVFTDGVVKALVTAAKAHYAGVWPPRVLNAWEGDKA